MGLNTIRTVGAESRATSGALAASLVASAVPAKFYALIGYSTIAQYIQLFDLAALPADATVPLITVPVLADQFFVIEFTHGIPMANGIVACNSTTAATKTIGAADCLFTVTYYVR